MPLDLEIVRTWNRANNGCGALAQAVRDLRGTPTAEAKGEALLLLDEARKDLAAAITLIDSQVAEIGMQLQTR